MTGLKEQAVINGISICNILLFLAYYKSKKPCENRLHWSLKDQWKEVSKCIYSEGEFKFYSKNTSNCFFSKSLKRNLNA